MKNSSISWTTHTFNPWIGCTKVSPGCLNCYAETLMDTRYGRVKWGAGNPRSRTAPSNWNKVHRWDREQLNAKHVYARGEFGKLERPRVFCASLADWLDDEIPIEWLIDLLDLVRTTPNLDWLMLTKRPQLWRERMEKATKYSMMEAPIENDGDRERDRLSRHDLNMWLVNWVYRGMAPANVWVGTTVEDQTRADLRVPQLLAIPAKIRFLSCEPMIGPLEFSDVTRRSDCIQQLGKRALDGIHWLICGGESGPGARHMVEIWAHDLRAQCAEAHVAFWMKQMGGHPNSRHELSDIPASLRIRNIP